MTLPKQRWRIAVPLGVVLVGIAALVFLTGLALGTMAGDGCPPGADFGIGEYWLLGVWPLLLLAGALAPPVLIWRKARWGWVALSALVGTLAAVGGFGVWLMIVQQVCYS